MCYVCSQVWILRLNQVGRCCCIYVYLAVYNVSWYGALVSQLYVILEDRHDITEILLKVALNTITLNPSVSKLQCTDTTLFKVV